jgi:hypothetical protein
VAVVRMGAVVAFTVYELAVTLMTVRTVFAFSECKECQA